MAQDEISSRERNEIELAKGILKEIIPALGGMESKIKIEGSISFHPTTITIKVTF